MEISRREMQIPYRGSTVTIIEKELTEHPKKGKSSISVFIPFIKICRDEIEVPPDSGLYKDYMGALIQESL